MTNSANQGQQLGSNAAWRMLSVLPPGPAVDAAARTVLDLFPDGSQPGSFIPGIVDVAISPQVLPHALTSDGVLRDVARDVWCGFTRADTARAVAAMAQTHPYRFVTALNPAAGLTHQELEEAVFRPVQATVVPFITELLHHSNVSPLHARVARNALAFNLPDSAAPDAHVVVQELYSLSRGHRLRHLRELYPFGHSPFNLDAIPSALLEDWRRSTPALYRAGAVPEDLREVSDINRFRFATAGPEEARSILGTLRSGAGGLIRTEWTGGKLFVNPWLRGALLHDDLDDWDMFLGTRGCKPIAGRLLGEELYRRVGDDPSAWVLGLEMLAGWEGSLVGWLDTVFALN